MGSRGPLAKPKIVPPGERDRTSHRRAAIVPLESAKSTPKTPTGLLPSVQRAWRQYWADPVSQMARPSDMRAITRLFRYYDKHERAMSLVDEHGIMVRGSMKQVRVNPVFDAMTKLETLILRLENELGLTPMARLRLGITLAEATDSLEEMNRKYRGHESRPDPRRATLDIPAADPGRAAAANPRRSRL